jgi:four helix bundle protein
MTDQFEDLIIWQRSHKLCVKLYQTFNSCNIYSLKEQLLRAGLSVPSNIAEGFERKSNKEFLQFLNIAKASCAELRAQLLVAKDIECIDTNKAEEFIKEAKEINYMINGFIKSRKDF